jgi:hypothetical protein
LGTIDVDPASCATAQPVVNATTYYTVEDDGLRHPWTGKVFCNPPYQMPEMARFCGKLLEELDARHTTEAVLLTNAVTDTAWFHLIAPRATAICFTDGRIPFLHATRDSLRPCQGQAVFYFGPQGGRFCEVFAAIGLLMQVLGAKVAGPQLELAGPPPAPPTPAPQPQPSPPRASGGLAARVDQAMTQFQRSTCADVAKQLGAAYQPVWKVLERRVQRGTLRKEGLTYSVVDAPGVGGDA